MEKAQSHIVHLDEETFAYNIRIRLLDKNIKIIGDILKRLNSIELLDIELASLDVAMSPLRLSMWNVRVQLV